MPFVETIQLKETHLSLGKAYNYMPVRGVSRCTIKSLHQNESMRAGLAFDFETYHAERRSLVEDRLAHYLAPNDPSPPQLWESMRYSVLSGGKRIRAILTLAAAEALLSSEAKARSMDEAAQIALPCACAIEMVHAMSLIHDDLPCMDDDDFRRGKPSNHKVFGEAMALLAGDALLIYATEILLKESSHTINRNNLIKVATELAAATGARGMVGGQVCDMAVTGQARSQDCSGSIDGAKLLNTIHERKTGALLRFSVWSGACLMGASDSTLKTIGEFGEILGLSFQIADDLLDVTGDIKTLGKTPGKDQASGKLTWVTVYGIESARMKLQELEENGKALLDKTGLAEESLRPLAALLEYSIHRSN